MKKVAYLFLLTCCSAFVSCSEGIETNDSSPEVKSVTRIVASIDSPIDDQPSTRMNFIESNGTFTWAISDTIGIFPNTGDQVSFPIEEGMENLTTVDFNGGGWDLKADATYYAYFPFNRNNFWGYDAKYALKISFLGQKQNGKDNADFAATYPFASFGVNNNGNVHFRFKQIASLAQFSITAPNPATFVKAILTTEDGGNYFVQEGTFNLMETTLDEPPTISGKSYGPTIEMALENISTTSENETFILYITVPPTVALSSEVKLMMIDKSGNLYTANSSQTIAKFNAGRRYKRDFALINDGMFLLNVEDDDFSSSEDSNINMKQ